MIRPLGPILSAALCVAATVFLAAAGARANGLIYVAHREAQRVGVYDPALARMTGSIPVGPSPRTAGSSPSAIWKARPKGPTSCG
jgi:hypothetical protein